MKVSDFTKIKFKKFKYYNNLSTKQKEIVGWDTETIQGKCVLLCNSDNLKLVFPSIDDVLNIMTDKKYNRTCNLFYNLEYDTNAIIKLLPEKNIIDLANKSYTIYNNFEISIIPNKLLKIKKKDDKKAFNYFDLWQFFKYEKDSSLDNVSKKYLNSQKQDISKFDINNLKKEDILNPEFQKYCLQDCYLTKRLGEMTAKACNKINLKFNRPYSCATLSIDYIHGYHKLPSPYLFLFQKNKNYNVSWYAYNSYKGGRFELLKRGSVNQNVFEYDINSAYPYFISQLKDIFSTDFSFVKNEQQFDRLLDKNTYYAFLKIKVEIERKDIGLLPYNQKGLLIYPVGCFTTFITLPELKMLDKYNVEYKILDGYVGTTYSNKKPYYDIINTIYKERKKYDKSNYLNMLYKIIMNSYYGKLIEVNGNYEIIDNPEEQDILNMEFDEELGDFVQKNWYAGKYFNPVYASYITSQTRVMITEAMLQNPDNIIGCFTDSVMSLEPLKLKCSNKLGEWEMEKWDNGIFVGSGVYYLERNENVKIRSRGFMTQNLKDFDFKKFVTNEHIFNKPLKLKESVKQHRINELNTFQKQIKVMDLNFDKKRKWNAQFTFKYLIDSKPIEIKEVE